MLAGDGGEAGSWRYGWVDLGGLLSACLIQVGLLSSSAPRIIRMFAGEILLLRGFTFVLTC